MSALPPSCFCRCEKRTATPLAALGDCFRHDADSRPHRTGDGAYTGPHRFEYYWATPSSDFPKPPARGTDIDNDSDSDNFKMSDIVIGAHIDKHASTGRSCP